VTATDSAPSTEAGGAASVPTVRDAAFATMRALGMTRIFGNPGSTEIPFLTDLPSDIEFVLALHEGSVVGMATGYALGRGEPAFVNLHTAPGLGNAVNAIANARDVKAPLVIVVGQQDRRQMAFQPFLTGRALERMAGEYPVYATLPARAQDVPGAIARAYLEAAAQRGPAIVVVPMGDWDEPAGEYAAGTPSTVLRPSPAPGRECDALAERIDAADAPAIVAGSGADSAEGFAAVVALAERLRCPVWQESFTHRVGFPQDHPQFAGHLPWRRREMRETLSDHDLVLAVGTNAFRLYILDEPSPPVTPGTTVAVVTEDPEEAHRSPCDIAVIAPVADVCARLASTVSQREGDLPPGFERPAPLAPPDEGEPLKAAHVLQALADRLPADAVLIEETPSSQPELYRRIPIRSPLGFMAGANGGLGFGISGAIGLRMGLPDRPVVAVLGDGSSLYAIQSLWSAARYGVGALLIVMANGRYAVMDGLARARGGAGAWPPFDGVDVAGMAECLGCRAVRVAGYDALAAELDAALDGRAAATEPLVLSVTVDG
jgi:benzoylformate decarboxylase